MATTYVDNFIDGRRLQMYVTELNCLLLSILKYDLEIKQRQNVKQALYKVFFFESAGILWNVISQ